ncbi:MAG: histidine phosphatase family protein [Salinivirgaceae bacterium]|nr:histidine phosphatase family protein [Salinivirgaceae bacterium]
MKVLSLMRHAKSSWEWPGLSDFDRPLLEKGIQRTHRTCQFMQEQKLLPQLVFSSRAVRARETALLVTECLKMKVEPLWVEAFYPGGVRDFLKQLAAIDDQVHHILIIGHNPGISDFACHVLNNQMAEWIPTSGCVSLELDILNWKDAVAGKAKLLHYIKPKELGKKSK